jgi:hypothetical protein
VRVLSDVESVHRPVPGGSGCSDAEHGREQT